MKPVYQSPKRNSWDFSDSFDIDNKHQVDISICFTQKEIDFYLDVKWKEDRPVEQTKTVLVFIPSLGFVITSIKTGIFYINTIERSWRLDVMESLLKKKKVLKSSLK